MGTQNKKHKLFKNILIIFLVVIILLLTAFIFTHHPVKPIQPTTSVKQTDYSVQDIKSVQIAGQNVKVDLALTLAEQAQGLSGRQSLSANTGMLFVFPTPGKYQFWMKDMLFPIDMVWIGEDMKVVYIKKDALPELYPQSYGPGSTDSNATYVLEVPDGFSDKNNLQIGNSVQFAY